MFFMKKILFPVSCLIGKWRLAQFLESTIARTREEGLELWRVRDIWILTRSMFIVYISLSVIELISFEDFIMSIIKWVEEQEIKNTVNFYRRFIE